MSFFSQIVIQLDPQDRIVSYRFVKSSCGQPVVPVDGLLRFCRKKKLEEIVLLTGAEIFNGIHPHTEEEKFYLYTGWEALRSAAARYLGLEHEDIDADRCHLEHVGHDAEGTQITGLLFPPKDLPKLNGPD